MLVDRNSFMNSIRAANYPEVRKFLNDPRALIGGSLVESKDEIGQRPIHLAAALKVTNILKLIVDEHGAEIDAVTDDTEFKRTALHVACSLGLFDTVKCLLDFGANPAVHDAKGNPPIFYARDGETRRAIQRAEQIFTNLEHVRVSFDYMRKFVGDGDVSAAVTEHLGEETDALRIVKTYQVWQKSIIPSHAVQNDDSDIPAIKIPGLSRVLKILRSMRNQKTMEEGYFAYIPKADMKDILVAFVRIAYVDYNGETAMQIADIFVQQRFRKRFFGAWLVTHTCEFALRGPRHISKVFAVIPDANYIAISFFLALGFFKEPAYKVPWRLRKQGQAVYHIHDSGYALQLLAKKLERYANHDIVWETGEERDAKKEEDRRANQAKDYKYWEMKLARAADPAPLPRLEVRQGQPQGLPLVPLGNETAGQRLLSDLSARRARRAVCEIDRVPADVAEGFRAQIERARLACDWDVRPAGSRRSERSRILGCPGELRSAWLEELDGLARLALPPCWISHADGQAPPVYFNTLTHERTPIRPTRDRRDALAAARRPAEAVLERVSSSGSGGSGGGRRSKSGTAGGVLGGGGLWGGGWGGGGGACRRGAGKDGWRPAAVKSHPCEI